jgi:DMSO/TMAO reductase YedYZ heme-binding membrane subunit
MIVLPFTLFLVLAAIKFKKFIRKNNVILYIVFTSISILAFIFIETSILTPFRQGFLGLAFFYVVMMAGALKNKSKLRISLMNVRREYSIIGFIVVTPHAIYQLIRYFTARIDLPLFGILGYVIMIPLFITSFMIIRKKFKYKNWKNLEKFAYIAYLGLFIHLIVTSKNPNTIIYIVLFGTYLILKLLYTYRYIKSRKVA